MNLPFPLQKLALFVSPSHFPSLPSLRGHHCGAEIRNEFTLSVAKIFSPHCSQSFKWREPGSAEALPILCVRYIRWERERERDTEKDGSDVTIVALKLAMNLHVPFAKIRTLAMNLPFPLPKLALFVSPLHTFRLSLHWEVTIVALKFAMSSHFPLPKIFSPHCSNLSNGASRATSDRKPRQMIKSCPVLFCFSHWQKWIKLIPKLLEIEKRLCVRWLGVINLTWENLQIAKHKSGRRSFSLADWFVLAICRLSQVRFITPSHLTHNLFFYFQ